MSEWKLDVAPRFADPAWLTYQGWMDLAHQPGFQQRARMVCDLVSEIAALRPVASLTDLGCGDGALLAMLGKIVQPTWGYDAGTADVAHGRSRGLDVRCADILGGELEFGELLVATEVVEHLEKPEAFLRSLPGELLVITSPSRETGDWHNEIHSWAWDLEGYAGLVTRSGWQVVRQAECDGGLNTFGGETRQQCFQAIWAVR